MRNITIIAAMAAAAFANPALAGTPDGHWQVKVLGTGVLPDGKITEVRNNALGLPANSQTKANDNVVPTLAIEYFATPEISVETICCLTQHHVNGAASIAGTRIVDHVLILPMTMTLKYHLGGGPIRPYVGAGPSLFLIMGEKPGATTRALGGARLKMSNEVGVALQAGVDVAVNDRGMGITLDAKKYFIDTTLHVTNVAGAEVLTTRHSLDPWVVSGGVYFHF